MPQVAIEDAIPALAAIGYTGVELTVLDAWSTRLESLTRDRQRMIRDLYATHDVDLPAIAAHSPLLHADPSSHAQSVWRVRGAMELALDLLPDDPPAINTTVGGKPEDWTTKQPLIVERVGAICAYAAELGVDVALEPHIGSAVHTPEQTLELIAQVNSPRLWINFDYSHFLAQGFPLEQCVRLLAPHTINTHLKGVTGREPDFEFVTPGEDDYDYGREIRLMALSGYDAYQTAEVSMHVQKRPDYDPFEHARLAFTRLDAAMHEAGFQE